MVRGTFANVRLRNELVPGVEGGVTRYLPDRRADVDLRCVDASMPADGTPLIVLAGKEYGSGSSRDWAAKGPYLLGIKAVIAESFERIHRSNLIGMGVLPLEYLDGADRSTYGLTGEEIFDITGIAAGVEPRMRLHVKATDPKTGKSIEFDVRAAHRHAERSRVLSPRRHPAVRPAPAPREGYRVTRRRPVDPSARSSSARYCKQLHGRSHSITRRKSARSSAT